jgi:signal transduction histidine kinase
VVRAVEDLLWFGEPVTGQTVETDLNAIVKGVIAQVAGDSPSARTVDEVYAAGLPRVTLDTKALARAVENLLRHALAASGQQGTVRVQTAVRAGAVHVRISNDGPALPPNEAEAVFDPFSARKGGVLNLGIATANQIVAAHGGQLSLLDNQPGHVTFEVAMPCPEVGGDHARTTG